MMTRQAINIFIVCFFRLWIVVNSQDENDSGNSNSPSILILGAGAAGMAAAHELERLGIKEYTIIEAADRIGGRMKNHEFGGRNVPIGATWVQGTKGSWFWELVEKGQVQGTYTDWDNSTMPNSTEENLEKLDEAWEKMEETKACMEDVATEMKKTRESDISLRQAQKLCGRKTFNDAISEYVEWQTFDFEYADLPVTTGTKNALPLTVYEIYADNDYHVTDSRGRMPVFDALEIPSSKIKLNTMVQEINYNDSGVTVVASDKSNNEIEFTADYAICTFSIGVLQEDHERLFKPSLPMWYKRELFKFDMNTYTKIFMRFPSNFWGDTLLFVHADEKRGYYPLWQHMGAPGYFDEGGDDYHVLMVTVVGEEAHRVERQTDEATKEEALRVLRQMFGSDRVPSDAGVVEIHVPRWNQDPLFRGSYSNWPIGTSAADHVELNTPLARRLFVKGEATHPSLNGYVHGALEEGRRAVREIHSCVADPEGDLCLCVHDTKCDTYDSTTSSGRVAATPRSIVNISLLVLVGSIVAFG